MKAGISIYIGLDNTLEENLQLIKDAADWRIKSIFTSFHIPETDTAKFKAEAQATLKSAKELGFDIISDISPNTMEILGMGSKAIDYASIAKLGITIIRLDDGFSPLEIAALSRNPYGLKVQLNASTCTESLMINLEENNAAFNNISALHNFYPRENTGISEKFCIEKNWLLHEYGIKTGAFIPSMNRPRSPIKAGLPTLEEHRTCSFDFALRHLIATGVDDVFVGDSLPSEEELKLLSLMPAHQVNLRADIKTKNPELMELLRQCYHTRADEARDCFRAEECRIYCKKNNLTVSPENTVARRAGDITLDNVNYQRYMGEMQILKCDLPADERVNVIASLNEEEQKLLKYLTSSTAFQFV